MVPLVGEAGRRRVNLDYVLLDDALARGGVEMDRTERAWLTT
jgi:hypothetical protein